MRIVKYQWNIKGDVIPGISFSDILVLSERSTIALQAIISLAGN